MVTGAPSDRQVAFRSAMSRVCTPVAVVTAVDRGRAHGTTVSAFCSLSMSPPMALISLDMDSDLLGVVRRTGTFGINVLAAGQSELARRFAKKGGDKFDGVQWTFDSGAARLAAVASWVVCATRSTIPGGDHLVVAGDVVAAESIDSGPLTYHAGTFGTHRQPEGQS